MILMDSNTSLHAHQHARPHIAAIVGDDVEIHAVVGRVRMIPAAIDIDSGGARHRADKAGVLHQRPVRDADAACTFLDVLVLAHGGHDLRPFGFELVEHLPQLASSVVRDVAANAADDAQRIGLAVAADLLGDPHDGLADAEALHEQRVEADDVTCQPDPQQVAVQALDLEHDGADVFGAGRRLERAAASTACT